MKSFRQLLQKLPAEFIERIQNDYQPSQAEKILTGMMVERPVTLRINTLKTNVREVMRVFQKDNIKFDRVLWYSDALIVKNIRETQLEKHSLYQEGHIYLQSLSSMVPPLALDPKVGQRILDLTAAPGSKSTQLAALMNNQGMLLANEINELRVERLKYNIDKQGASIIEIRHGDGKRLEENYRESFDAVLLDAPCSGEGLFLACDPKTYRFWNPKRVRELSNEQKKLLRTALWALKPGGTLIYSTCTLSSAENEAVLDWALEKYYPELKVESVALNGLQSLPNTGPGLAVGEFSKPNSQKYLRIYPTQLMEGFFVAKLRKGNR
ncbi:MAG TPA: NOL1/NOP2/sun family RNA methylase [Firmicutes bacterium]|jgi:NOL1/NOP2/sun family putative RNA methylase|nr:NOL1/NOP2/sun family RNA methylase [Bacillota bacterium]